MSEGMSRYETWLLCVNCAGTGATEVDGSDEMCRACDGWGRVPGPIPPRPDWSKAPEWAQWWVMHGYGAAEFLDTEPKAATIHNASWFLCPGTRRHADIRPVGECERIPIGIDWRTLIQKRPTQHRRNPGLRN